uniref:Uncharacterized protein n=1 Tax=Arion vulgaris TaxID=1028688 RepID=A0A0B7AP04_9EUPU
MREYQLMVYICGTDQRNAISVCLSTQNTKRLWAQSYTRLSTVRKGIGIPTSCTLVPRNVKGQVLHTLRESWSMFLYIVAYLTDDWEGAGTI